MVAFGGRDFTLGSPTDGDAYLAFASGLELDALHFSNSPTVLDLSPSVTINTGDVLFSVRSATSDIPGISSTSPGDIVLFQPASQLDYSPANGTFSVLLNVSGGNELLGITMVEKDTTLGDTIVEKGSFLFIDDSSPTDIQLLEIDSGVLSKQTLFTGVDVGITSDLMGIELIETTTILGNENLSEGTVLLSVATNNNDIGRPTRLIDVQDNDVFALRLDQTDIGSGKSAGSAKIIFDASTVAGLSGGGTGDIDSISIFQPIAEEQLVNNVAISLSEGQTVQITLSQLLTTDSDTSTDNLTYTLPAHPASGRILLDGVTTLNFTQADIDSGRVSYQHSGAEQNTDSVAVSVDDGFGTTTDFTLQFNINSVNDSPTLLQMVSPTFVEGSVNNKIVTANLLVGDPDDAPSEITFTVDTEPSSGKLFNGSTQLSAGDTFTQADINAGNITYSHNGMKRIQIVLISHFETAVKTEQFRLQTNL